MTKLSARATLRYALLAACAASVACQAADERLLGALDETAEIGQLTKVRSIPPKALSVAGVKVFVAELADLRAKFGFAPVTRTSGREGSPLALCYFAGDVALVFRAGAMGGWRRVTGFTAIRAGTLDTRRLDCVRSTTLTSWMRRPGNDLLNPLQLGARLGTGSLPTDGIVATKRSIVGGKEYSRTTTVAYSQGAPLSWMDLSQFLER